MTQISRVAKENVRAPFILGSIQYVKVVYTSYCSVYEQTLGQNHLCNFINIYPIKN